MPQQQPTFSSDSPKGPSSREASANRGPALNGSPGLWPGMAGRLWRGLQDALPERPLRAIFATSLAFVVLALSLLWLASSTLPERGSPLAMADSSQKREKQEVQDSTQAQPAEKERSKEDGKVTEEESQEEPSVRSSGESSPSESSPSESSSNESSDGASGERTYSFAGSVSKYIPEVESRPNASGGESRSSSSSASQGGKSGKGDSRSKKDGSVPELTIQVTRSNIMAIADRFGYQMAAITGSGDAILGTVEGGTLRSLSEGELSRYAGRARSARRHPKYQEILRQVAQQVPDQGAGSIQLIYLVPKTVENRFVRAQMQALERKGLSPDDVAKMEARPRGQSIEITGITRK